jgi:hypothetical protein
VRAAHTSNSKFIIKAFYLYSQGREAAIGKRGADIPLPVEESTTIPRYNLSSAVDSRGIKPAVEKLSAPLCRGRERLREVVKQ